MLTTQEIVRNMNISERGDMYKFSKARKIEVHASLKDGEYEIIGAQWLPKILEAVVNEQHTEKFM